MDPRPKQNGAARDAYDEQVRLRAKPQYYFHAVEQALQQLARWLRIELIYFKQQIMHWDSDDAVPGFLVLFFLNVFVVHRAHVCVIQSLVVLVPTESEPQIQSTTQ